MIPRSTVSVLRQVRTQLRPRNSTPVTYHSVLARLLSSLAVLEQRDGKLNQGSLGAVTAAQKLGGSITGFIAGGNIKAVAEEAAKVLGIEKIISIDNAAYDKVGQSGRLLLDLDLRCIGLTRELRPFISREYKDGGIYTCDCRSHSIRKGSDAPRCRTA